MSQFRIFLEPLHDSPAIDPWKTDIKDDGAGLVVVGKMETGFPILGDQAEKSSLPAKVPQHLGKASVILNNEQAARIGSDALTVIFQVFTHPGRRCLLIVADFPRAGPRHPCPGNKVARVLHAALLPGRLLRGESFGCRFRHLGCLFSIA